ncbi:hypothetical protein F4820DRAFT_157407 [Hypoxylon rubiginosum]|uniref:Uncharacterized protein n=1 Tax=Hypoxylon rubiginosum TaxID=110542 RepID=A0ACB9YL32_9PEZI|nr:hypothetical protein F4820DRAFT_157407 [Hypoxylon rubiginosum]
MAIWSATVITLSADPTRNTTIEKLVDYPIRLTSYHFFCFWLFHIATITYPCLVLSASSSPTLAGERGGSALGVKVEILYFLKGSSRFICCCALFRLCLYWLTTGFR